MTETNKTGRVVVLGPVAVTLGTGTVAPQSPVNRALLGALGAADGRPIRTESLARLLGHADPDGPAARTAVQVAVHRLRRWLEENGGGLSVDTTTIGYALHAIPLDTDVRRFRALVARATGLAGKERSAALHQALSLWRGEPLADVPHDRRDHEAIAQLERERVSAARLYANGAIAQGSAEAAAEMLSPLTQRDPLDEQTHSLLIRALAAAGRQAEALAAYQKIRGALRTELDAAPGPELEAAHLAVLRPAEPVPSQPEAPVTLDLLPPSVDHFTGRTDLLARLRDQVRDWAAGDGAAITAISGRPGVGKTALAVHAAHELAEAFPGGRLYVDLRGAEAVPLDPHDVLDRFLRVFGVPEGTIPESREERAALYRSRLADSRTLVLLDNAVSEEQVRTLLPGVGCLVLVTSRILLSGLAGATQLELDCLSEVDALALLTAVVGSDRLALGDADSGAAIDLVQRCGLLPLALRIVAAQLGANPHWTVGHLAGLLADERRRLERLSFDHLDVRASFNLTYVGLAEPAQRLFRALSALDLADFPAWHAQALLDVPAGDTGALDELVEARLVDVAGVDGLNQPRLLLHDLVRLFGRERSRAEDDEAAIRSALGRVFDGWLYLTQQAEAKVGERSWWTLSPRWPRPAAITVAQSERLLAEPLRLLAVERDRAARSTIQASALDLTPVCWELAASLVHYWQGTCGWDDWRQTQEAALAASRRTGDLLGEAVSLYGLGAYHMDQHQNSASLRALHQSGVAFRAAGDPVGEAEVQSLLGAALRRAGRLDEAEVATSRALQLFETRADSREECGFAWWNLGWLDMHRRRFDSARRRMGRALELSSVQSPRQHGMTLHGFAMLEYWAGNHVVAIEWCERELAVWRDTQERRGAAYALLCLGQNLTGLGRYDASRLALLDGFALFEEFGMLDGLGQTLTALATLHRLTGDPETSLVMMGRSLELWEQVEAPTHAAEAWIELGEVHDVLGQPDEARQAREQSIPLLVRMGSPLADEMRARL